MNEKQINYLWGIFCIFGGIGILIAVFNSEGNPLFKCIFILAGVFAIITGIILFPCDVFNKQGGMKDEIQN